MRGKKGSDDLPRHQSLSSYDTGGEVELLMLSGVKMSAVLTDSNQGRTTLNCGNWTTTGALVSYRLSKHIFANFYT